MPWDSIVPKRIVDLVATPREGRLLLEWTTPKENADKTLLTDLTEFKVLRSEGVLVGDECRGCGEKSKVVYEMKLTKEDFIPGKKMALFFEDQVPRRVYVYDVISINRRGDPSSPSNPVTVSWDHPPQAPGMMTAERGDKRVELSWDPVEGATGYNVYRRTEEDGSVPAHSIEQRAANSNSVYRSERTERYQIHLLGEGREEDRQNRRGGKGISGYRRDSDQDHSAGCSCRIGSHSS